MDAGWVSFTSEGLGDDPLLEVPSFDNQDDQDGQDGQNEYQHRYSTAPPMDRSILSGSSMQSDQSFSSNQEQIYKESPLTNYDSPQPELSPPPQFNQLSLEMATSSREGAEKPFLFNIEKDGDPRIKWRMYYDFKVTKNEAYLELQEGYLPTQNYPFRIMTEKITKNGDKLHRCLHLNCTAKPFTRHYDLERHVKIHQADGSQVNCDYKRCPHKVPFRKDHCREHYREYHAEDVVKRGSPKSTKPMEGQKQSEPLEKFMSTRIGRLDLAWWRCTKCIIRVQVDDHSYVCPKCKQACEPVRVAWREIAHKVAKGEIVSPCGQCENMWVADAKNPNNWVPCSRCRKDG